MRFQRAVRGSDTGRGLGACVRVGAVVWFVGVAPVVSPAHTRQGDTSRARRTATSSGSLARRSPPLRVVQLLEYRPAGADARVRFEWDQVSGAREYRLVGRWTGTMSWIVKTREYAVTTRSATIWTSQRVTFEVPIPLGNHSWRLLAAFGPNDLRMLGDSTPVSFAIK